MKTKRALNVCPEFFFFFLSPSHLFSSPYFSSSRPLVTQIRGDIYSRHFPLLLRCAPSFLSREESAFSSLVDLRRIVHTHAARGYMLVNFCARKSALEGFELTQSTLVSRHQVKPLVHRGDRLQSTLKISVYSFMNQREQSIDEKTNESEPYVARHGRYVLCPVRCVHGLDVPMSGLKR